MSINQHRSSAGRSSAGYFKQFCFGNAAGWFELTPCLRSNICSFSASCGSSGGSSNGRAREVTVHHKGGSSAWYGWVNMDQWPDKISIFCNREWHSSSKACLFMCMKMTNPAGQTWQSSRVRKFFFLTMHLQSWKASNRFNDFGDV